MRSVRRVATGHDAMGNAIFMIDGAPTHGTKLEAAQAEFFEIWSTSGAPTTISIDEREPTDRPLTITPPPCGSIVRIVDIHPKGSTRGSEIGTVNPADVFGKIGSANASTWKPNARHPLMHRTETVDYGIVLEGEIYLILDEDETLLEQGNIVIQRGTNHAWENRSDQTCRIAFILLDGAYDARLKAVLAQH